MRKVTMTAQEIYDNIHALKLEVSDLEEAIEELTDYGAGPAGRKSVEILKELVEFKRDELKAMQAKLWVPDLVSEGWQGKG